MKPVLGNTFPVKDELKAIGARWNAGAKCWMVPDEYSAAAQELVDTAHDHGHTPSLNLSGDKPGFPSANGQPLPRSGTRQPLPPEKYVPKPATGAPAKPSPVAGNSHSNGNQSNGTAPKPETPIVHTALSKAYAGAGIAAVDALMTIQRYAESKGLKLEFAAEDVRMTATALFIDAQKQGGAAWQH